MWNGNVYLLIFLLGFTFILNSVFSIIIFAPVASQAETERDDIENARFAFGVISLILNIIGLIAVIILFILERKYGFLNSFSQSFA